jgi:hypothetical protein
MTIILIDTGEVSEEVTVLTSSIRARLTDMAGHKRNALRSAIAAGKDLLELQRQLPSRQFFPYLKQTCDLKKSQVDLYTRLARHAPEIEAQLAVTPNLSIRAARVMITKKKKSASESYFSPASRRAFKKAAMSAEARRRPPPGEQPTLSLSAWKWATKAERRAFLAAIPGYQLLESLPEGFGLLAEESASSNVVAFPTPRCDSTTKH